MGTLAVSESSAATIYNANDWYATATNATSISNGGTTSATLNYSGTATDNAAQTSLWSYFAPNGTPVQLLDGDRLTFSAGIAVDFVSASSKTVTWRIGILDSTTPRASTDGAGGTVNYGVDRIGAGTGTEGNVRNGWTGVVAESDKIYRRDQSNSTSWSSLGGSSSSVTMTTPVVNQVFLDNVPVSLTLNLGRVGNNLVLDGTLGASTFSGTYVDYFASGYPATFDAVGLYLGSNGTGSVATGSITVSNAIISVVPEPATYALIFGAFGMLVLLRRRSV